MKLVMTLLVRDEEDIIEANLRHHLAVGIDEIIVTDNRSVDGTRGILDSYAESGRVRVLSEPGDDYSQSAWVTRMARLAAEELRADWVLHADADEFFMAVRGSLRDALASVPPEYGVLAVPRLNFEPVAGGPGPFYERMIVRQAEATNALGQPLPGKVCHRAGPEVIVGDGNHKLRNPPGTTWSQQPVVIFHYPMRTFGQFEHKIMLGGGAVSRREGLRPSTWRSWRWLYELHGQGKLREWYEARELTPARIEAGLHSGDLVIDRRMTSRLQTLLG